MRRPDETIVTATEKPTAERPGEDEERRRLEKTWAEPKGFFGWFTHVHHTSIGRRFIITAFIFFLLGGLLAVLMRIQLARPENTVRGPDR